MGPKESARRDASKYPKKASPPGTEKMRFRNNPSPELGNSQLPSDVQAELAEEGEHAVAARKAPFYKPADYIPALDTSPGFVFTQDEIESIVSGVSQSHDVVLQASAAVDDAYEKIDSYRATASRLSRLADSLGPVVDAKGKASTDAALEQARAGLREAIDSFDAQEPARSTKLDDEVD